MILLLLPALVMLAVIGLAGWVRIGAREYYTLSEKAFRIPGLSEGVIGQALCADGDDFLMAGYMKDGSATRLYVIGRGDGQVRKCLTLADEEGRDLAAHAACMAVHGGWIYITGDTACALYAFEKSALETAPDGGKLSCAGRFEPAALKGRMRVDIVSVCGDSLAVGEFYHEPGYPTPASHHLTAPDGSERHALCLLFPLREGAPLGIGDTPQAAWSIPDTVQGIEIAGGRAYFSLSWGLSLSACEVHDLTRVAERKGFTWEGAALPLYVFDSSSLAKRLVLPPMSEQMAYTDGRLYTLSESASARYLFGRLYGGGWCLGTDVTGF